MGGRKSHNPLGGGHGSRKEGYEKKLLVTGTMTHVTWEGVSQCGGI